MKLRVVFAGHGLHAGRSIDVSDGRQLGPVLFADVDRSDHVRKLGHGRHVEPLADLLQRHGGREGAKCLPHLDHGVDAIAHLRATRIGENAAMAERTRPEFHASAVPGDDPAFRNQAGGLGASLGQRVVAAHLNAIAEFFDCRLDLLRRMHGAEIRGRKSGVVNLAGQGCTVKRGSQRGAVIARRGLHVDFVEKAGTHEPAIGSAIERDTARQRHPPQPAGLPKMPADVEHDFIQAFLQRSRHVAVIVGNVVIGPPLLYQVFFQILSGCGVVFAFVSGAVQAERRDADRAIRTTLHGLFKE